MILNDTTVTNPFYVISTLRSQKVGVKFRCINTLNYVYNNNVNAVTVLFFDPIGRGSILKVVGVLKKGGTTGHVLRH